MSVRCCGDSGDSVVLVLVVNLSSLDSRQDVRRGGRGEELGRHKMQI